VLYGRLNLKCKEMKRELIEVLLKHSEELSIKSSLLQNPEKEEWLWSGDFENVINELTPLIVKDFMSWLWVNYNVCHNANNNDFAIEKYLKDQL